MFTGKKQSPKGVSPVTATTTPATPPKPPTWGDFYTEADRFAAQRAAEADQLATEREPLEARLVTIERALNIRQGQLAEAERTHQELIKRRDTAATLAAVDPGLPDGSDLQPAIDDAARMLEDLRARIARLNAEHEETGATLNDLRRREAEARAAAAEAPRRVAARQRAHLLAQRDRIWADLYDLAAECSIFNSERCRKSIAVWPHANVGVAIGIDDLRPDLGGGVLVSPTEFLQQGLRTEAEKLRQRAREVLAASI